jgi:transketolase
MRTAFIESLIEQARLHENIFLLVGDLGYSVVEKFRDEFPSRFLNAGVAEQNMVGVAAGLASEGWHVFTYSIANFPTLRCLEQIRNDVCYHNLPVTTVSVGAGVAYGNLGYSHHAVQDIAIMRSLPRMKVLGPADPSEARACVSHLAEVPGPSYLRLGKAGEKTLMSQSPISASPTLVHSGATPVALVATGSVLEVALEAARLARGAARPAVFSMPWLAPLGSGDLACLADYQRIICLQEHVSEGGLGDILRANLPSGREVLELSLSHNMTSEVGAQRRLREIAGITAARAMQLCAL